MTDEKMENAEKVARCLTDFVNPYGHDNRLVAEALTYEHRTLQQQTFELMMVCVDTWANLYDSGNYDGRNEYTVKTCKKIRDSFGDDWKYMIRVPLI